MIALLGLLLAVVDRGAELPAPSQFSIVSVSFLRLRTRILLPLVKSANPCAVKQRDLEALLRKYRRRQSVFEAVSFGVVAHCGAESVVLGLPLITAPDDLQHIRQANPEAAGLWDLASRITDRFFGPNDPFLDVTEAV